MTSLSEASSTPRRGVYRPSGRARRSDRVAHFLRVACGAAMSVMALSFLFAAQPSGNAIRADLGTAAARLDAIPMNAAPARVRALLVPEGADVNAGDALVALDPM